MISGFTTSRGASTRFTFDPGLESSPVWSPDGRRIVYARDRDGAPHLFWKSLGDAGEGEMLTPSVGSPQNAFDFTPDGRTLLYSAREAKTGHDILTLQLDGERKADAFLRTQFYETSARLSPDGRWVAYASDESGRYEVYVRPFPEGGEPAQVSNAGGAAPRWRRDGRELFYVTLPPDRSIVAVPVGVEGGAFKAGAPAPLFKVELNSTDYDVSADGQRFIINTTAGVPPTPLSVRTGWAAALER